MKNDQEKLTNLVFDNILKIFDEYDLDDINDPENLTRFFYAISITGPHAFFNYLATKKVTEKEFHELIGEIMNELR